MTNSRRSFVTALVILASLILFGGSLVTNEHAMAQNPTGAAAERRVNERSCQQMERS